MVFTIEGINDFLAQILGFGGPLYGYLYAGLIIIVTLVVMKLVGRFIGTLLVKAESDTHNSLDEKILEALKRPVSIGILLGGIFLALRSLPLLILFSADINSAFTVIFSFYAAYFASKIVGMAIEWYAEEVAHRTKTSADDQFLPIIKRVAYGVIFGIVIIVMLNQLGIRVETLIATLGIGGLAVALALQPTLANFFSGMQMVLDRPLRIGDYVELDSGKKGTVVDIGWRSTKIRTYMNNIVAIPNSKLSDSMIINYNTPTAEIGFSVECGVAYDSDLEKVEKVCLEVAREVLNRYEGVKGFEPLFRYREFGASSINFKVIMRTKTLGDSYLATHEFIKALKHRFDDEGIEISFPQLDVHFDEHRKAKPRRPVRKAPRRKAKRK